MSMDQQLYWLSADRLKLHARGYPGIRGGRSEPLSAATAERMAAALYHAQLVMVADVGHAAMRGEAILDEPDHLLAKVAG